MYVRVSVYTYTRIDKLAQLHGRHCKVSVRVNENVLLSRIIAPRYWSDELVVWRPIGWRELLLITKELLDLYISCNRASEPCAMKSFQIYQSISGFIASSWRKGNRGSKSRIRNMSRHTWFDSYIIASNQIVTGRLSSWAIDL